MPKVSASPEPIRLSLSEFQAVPISNEDLKVLSDFYLGHDTKEGLLLFRDSSEARRILGVQGSQS